MSTSFPSTGWVRTASASKKVSQADRAGRQATAKAIAIACFSIWGLAYGLLDVLNKHFQETLNVVTRKLQRAATPAEAGRLLDEVLLPLWRGAPSPAFYRRGLELQQRYSLAFYDALIVAAALEAGCTRLLSEDLQHGLRIERLTVENPFKS